VQSSHAAGAVSASFTDPNLIASAGLVPLVRLAEQHGLPDLISAHVSLGVTTGTNAAGKALTIVAGMCAGADSIDDLDMLRTGGMDKVFDRIYAPSTLGAFLRSFTHGHVRQLQAATGRFTAGLIGSLGLLADSDVIYLDIDSKVKQVYGPDKQGASFGYTKVRGLHFLIVTASTPTSRPVIVATRLRAGKAGSGRGAASLVAEAIRALRRAGITATILVRADSAFFSAKLVKACRDAPGVQFSICTCPTAGPGPTRSTGSWPAPDTESSADQREHPIHPRNQEPRRTRPRTVNRHCDLPEKPSPRHQLLIPSGPCHRGISSVDRGSGQTDR
jgi:hypothetical protein